MTAAGGPKKWNRGGSGVDHHGRHSGKKGVHSAEVQARRLEVSRLVLKGVRGATELARRVFNTPTPTKSELQLVRQDKHLIKKAWRKQVEANASYAFGQEVRTLETLLARALADYEESCKERQVRTTVTRRRPILDHAYQPVLVNGVAQFEETTTVTERGEGRAPGDPRFFALAVKIHDQLCKLLGINREVPQAPGGGGMTYDEAVQVLKRLGLTMAGGRPVLAGPAPAAREERVTGDPLQPAREAGEPRATLLTETERAAVDRAHARPAAPEDDGRDIPY